MLEGESLVSAETPLFIKEPDLLLQRPSEKLYFLFEVLQNVSSLLQNPQYTSTATYVIYAHLLRQIATLPEADHHFLMHWFKK